MKMPNAESIRSIQIGDGDGTFSSEKRKIEFGKNGSKHSRDT